MRTNVWMPLLAVAALVSGFASAGSITCAGTVATLSYHSPDTFMVRLSSMNVPVFVCKPNGTFSVPGASYTTSAETCRALMAIFIAARESGREFGGIWFDGDDVPTSCDAWGTWKSANIRHFSY